MKSNRFKFKGFFLYFIPGFAAGLFFCAAAGAWSGRTGRPQEERGGTGRAENPGGAAETAGIIDISEIRPSDGRLEPKPLSWRVSFAERSDDRFPVLRLSANRMLFTSEATNGVEGVTVKFEGRPIQWRVVGAPLPGTTGDWIWISPAEPVESGEIEVVISKDFPDPAGKPSSADTRWCAQYSPEPVFVEHVESKAEPFCAVAKTTVWLSREIPEDALADCLAFEPGVKNISIRRTRDGAWHRYDGSWGGWNSSRYEIEGDFSPGTRYIVRFRDRIVKRTQGNLVFASTNDVVFTAQLPSPDMEWLDEGRNLGGRGLGNSIAIRADRVPCAEISLRRVLPQNIVHAVANWDNWTHDMDDWCEAPVVRFADKFSPDGISTNLISLDDFAPPGQTTLPDGLWALDVKGVWPTNETCGTEAQPSLSRLVAVSDVALTVRKLDSEILAWATAISSGEPVTNAAVTLYGKNNSELSSATTGSDGTALLPVPDGRSAPAVVLAETKDGRYAFLELSERNYVDEMPERPAEKFPEAASSLDGWITTDRGIYRHGDRVYIEALVREAGGSAPAPRPVALEIERGDGATVASWTLMTDARGRVSVPGGFFEIPDSQPTGTWRIRLFTKGKDGIELATCSFSVEAFVPPKIKVSIGNLPDCISTASLDDSASKLKFDVSAGYFFGSPAAGLKYSAVCHAAPAAFSPKGWDEEWHFGAPSRKTATVRSTEAFGELSADGSNLAEVALPKLATPPAAAMHLVVQASVFEHGGRAVTVEKALDWHVYPYYIAVRPPDAVSPGRDASFRIRFVMPDGLESTNAPAAVAASLVRVRNEWLWEKTGGEWQWRRHWIEEPVADGRFPVVGGEAVAVFALPQGVRDYLLRVSPAVAETGNAIRPETEVEFSSDGMAVRPAQEPYRVEITLDRKSYCAGDTAKVAIRSPFGGLALFTLQQRSAVRRWVRYIESGDTAFTLPLDVSMAPSVDLAVSVVRKAAAGEDRAEHRACGATTIKVSNPALTLVPALSQPLVEAREGGGWRITAEAALATIPEARGAKATFFLVDQAVLDLTDEPVPDPSARFGRERWSGAALFDSFKRLLRLHDGPALRTAATGGDAVAAAGMKRRLQAAKTRRFEPLAMAVQNVPFADGVAKAVFDLPEFSGSVRIVAVVWSSCATGVATTQVKLAPALVLEADAPRFLAPGDSTQLSLAIHSTSAESATVEWSCRMEPFVSTNGTATLTPKGSAVAKIPVSIPLEAACGELNARFDVSGSGEKHSLTLRLPLRAAVPVKTESKHVVIAPGETVEIGPAEGFSSVSYASLRADPDLWSGVSPAMRYLGRYSWRCLEQTSSRALAFLAGNGAALELSPDACADASGEIDAALARVLSMLRRNYFTVWPDSDYENVANGAWAGLFLAEATASGRPLPASAHGKLVAALRRYATMPAPDRRWDDTAEIRAKREKEHSSTRTTALLALRALGTPDAETESALFDRQNDLSEHAKAQLSLCLLRGGRPDDALWLLRSLRPGDSVHALCWAIVAWSQIDLPETVERIETLRSRLMSLRMDYGDGEHWGSTRENAAAAIAAASCLRRWGRSSSAPQIVATVAGRPSVCLTNIQAVAMDATVGSGKVLLQNSAAFPVTVERIVEGMPDVATFAAATNGIAVSRRYFRPSGEEADPGSGAIKCGDTLIVEILLRPAPDDKATLENVVIDELLPAGLEPDPASMRYGWAQSGENTSLAVLHCEVRDDRVVAFAAPFSGERVLRYFVQAVTPGTFALPPVQAGEMYRPQCRGNSATGVLRIAP